MLKPIEKPHGEPLVHHPSSALDLFCHYEPTDANWLQFDESLSEQIASFEKQNRQYIRQRQALARRSST